MCDKTTPVEVWIPADLSCTGKEKLATKAIDSCIANLVSAFHKDGVKTRGSCCGHGKLNGTIVLQDGRILEIWPQVSIAKRV